MAGQAGDARAWGQEGWTGPPFAARRARADDADRRRARLAALARLMDSAYQIPGLKVRVGLDALIGLLPVGGDAVTTAVQLYIIWEARKLGATRKQLTQMLGNVALDAAIGLIPGVGDLFDVAWKANVRNLRIMGFDVGGPAPRAGGPGRRAPR